MALIDTLLADIKEAMKARDAVKTTALRGLNAQIKDATVNAGKPLTDEAVVMCVNKAIKQREDSIEQFTKGGREDLVAKEQAELELIRKYQPKQLTREEVEVVVKNAIVSTGISSKKEMGKLMGAVMPQVKGKVDGKIVKDVVNALLQ